MKEDLPAWCRMVGHALLSVEPAGGNYLHFRIAKHGASAAAAGAAKAVGDAPLEQDLEKARRFAWSARVRWTGGMQAKAFVRNHSFAIGQPASFDTADPAPSAIEYLLSALGGCLAVGFQWRASRRGIEVRQLEVALKATADDILVFLGIDDPSKGHPGLAAIEGSLYVDADAEDDALQALFEETVVRSPIAQSLLRKVAVDVKLRRA